MTGSPASYAFNDALNVEVGYGADPSGATDSYPLIQAAFNAATPGQLVYIPVGTFKLSASPVCPAGVYWYLAGTLVGGSITGGTQAAWGGGGGGGSGTVTSASVVSANGFAGTVANPTTTPAITLRTSVTGLMKGNGTGAGAAVAGTDFIAPVGGRAEQYTTLSSATGPTALDLTTANVFNVTLTGPVTFSFSGATAGKACSFTLYAWQDATGSRTVTWPGGIVWLNGAVPAVSPVPSTVSAYSFESLDGASWIGSVLNNTAATTSTPGTVQFDATAGDLQALGVAALGTTGKVPDAGHAHPDKPWFIYPETYGAIADGKIVTDGAMTSGQNVLTCATSTPFTAGDVNKYVLVWQGSGNTVTTSTFLFARITGFTSSTQVTLSANATATFTGGGTVYGTDNTAAIQSAVNAANARSQLGNGTSADVKFGDGIYCMATSAANNATTANRTQVSLPIVNAATGVKSQIGLVGTGSNQLPHWLQTNPSQAGTILLSMPTDGALNTAPGYGPSSCIAGPVLNYGGGGGTFSNMHVRVKGMSVVVPFSTTNYCGIDLFGVGQASVDDFSYLPLMVVPGTVSGGINPVQPWPTFTAYGNPTYYPTYTFGLRMPANGNNAVSDIGTYTSYFTQISLIGSEHMTFRSIRTLYSQYGILPHTVSGGSMTHGISGVNWCCESVRYPIGSVASGYFILGCAISFSIVRLELEVFTAIVNDAASKIYGQVNFQVSGTGAGATFANAYVASTGTGLKLIHIEAAQGLVASPPAMTATGAPQVNTYYRDASVNVQPNGATITNIQLDGTILTGITSGPVRVPSGHSITVTYTGGTPVWQWTLDL